MNADAAVAAAVAAEDAAANCKPKGASETGLPQTVDKPTHRKNARSILTFSKIFYSHYVKVL